MKQGIQTTLKQNKMIVDYGCYFLCLLELSGRLTGLEISEGRIYDFYFNFVNNGAMKKDCTILDPAWIMKYLTGKKFDFTRPLKTPDYPYYVIENTKQGYTHFTLMWNNESWDPLDPLRPAAKDYKPNSYRLLRELVI